MAIRSGWIGSHAPRPPDKKAVAMDTVDETPDSELAEQYSFDPEVELSEYAGKFRAGPWRKVTIRAFALLAKLSGVRRTQGRPPLPREASEKTARLIGEYHVYRHTPRIERSEDWPKNKTEFCSGYGITVEALDHALSLVRYHKWEGRFLDVVSPEVRVAMMKDSLMYNVLRQDTVEDASKVNANLYRTGLQSEGEIKGTQKITQVNVGSNVLNMPEGFTEDDARARLERLNRLTEKLAPREVTHTEVPE